MNRKQTTFFFGVFDLVFVLRISFANILRLSGVFCVAHYFCCCCNNGERVHLRSFSGNIIMLRIVLGVTDAVPRAPTGTIEQRKGVELEEFTKFVDL